MITSIDIGEPFDEIQCPFINEILSKPEIEEGKFLSLVKNIIKKLQL